MSVSDAKHRTGREKKTYLVRKFAHVVGLQLLSGLIGMPCLFKGFGGIGASDFDQDISAAGMVFKILCDIVDCMAMSANHGQCLMRGRSNYPCCAE